MHMRAWQQSLKEARQAAKMLLGRNAGVSMAEHNSGIYRGVIIAHTRDYIVQQIGRQAAAVIHPKERFGEHEAGFPWPEVGRNFSIQYAHSLAVAREIRERALEYGRSR
jgi:hypothetical protein